MRVIGIMGPLGAGKSTAAKHLIEKYGFRKFSMADPLKAGLRAMGLPVEWETDRSLREVPQDLLCGKTWRWAAQSIGTEWGRKLIGKNIWVNLTEQRIKEYALHYEVASGTDALIVFDDIRFPNEVEMVRRLGGEIWMIRGRNETVPPLWKRVLEFLSFGLYRAEHESERHWRTTVPDYTITNSFSEDLFRHQVDMGFEKDGSYRNAA